MKAFFLLPFLTASLFAGPIVSVKNTAGTELSVELISVKADTVTFKNIENNQTYRDVPLSSLAPESVVLLKKAGAALPAPFPEVETDVVVSKRRKSDDSYYMKTMTVGATVKLSNKSMKENCPPAVCRLVFIGENRATKDLYAVLATRDFELAPAAGKTAEATVREFETTYDSDSKGAYNIGGYQYEGYLLIVRDKKGNLVTYKTLSGTLGKAISSNVGLLDRFTKIAEGTLLGKGMIPEAPAGAPATLPDVVPN